MQALHDVPMQVAKVLETRAEGYQEDIKKVKLNDLVQTLKGSTPRL